MNVMRQKDEIRFPSPPAKKTTPPVFSFQEDEADGKEETDDDSEILATLSDNTSKTTAVVQVTGALDVLVTPLLLESLQRCVGVHMGGRVFYQFACGCASLRQSQASNTWAQL